MAHRFFDGNNDRNPSRGCEDTRVGPKCQASLNRLFRATLGRTFRRRRGQLGCLAVRKLDLDRGQQRCGGTPLCRRTRQLQALGVLMQHRKSGGFHGR
jgi:hypothetical protein